MTMFAKKTTKHQKKKTTPHFSIRSTTASILVYLFHFNKSFSLPLFLERGKALGILESSEVP